MGHDTRGVTPAGKSAAWRDMKARIIARLLVVCGLCLLGATLRGAEQAAKAETIAALIAAGEKTHEQLKTRPARWITRVALTPEATIVVRTYFDGSRRADSFYVETEGKLTLLMRLLMDGDEWIVEHGDDRKKYRPYEALLPLPAAYFYHALATGYFVNNAAMLEDARLEGSAEGIVTFRIELDEAERRALERTLATIEAMPPAAKDKAAERERARARAKSLLAEGTPLRVDRSTGRIIETRVHQLTVTYVGFELMDQLPANAFTAPAKAADHTTPFHDPQAWIMVMYDPHGTLKTKPAVDGHLLHAKTGEIRRLPFEDTASGPLCFLPGREAVLATGSDAFGATQLYKLDLKTGENTPVPLGRYAGWLPAAATLSPDGKEVALIMLDRLGANPLDFQMVLLNLESEEVTPLGKPGPLGGPHAWLSDGSGLILKRFVGRGDPNGIEERIVCRLGRDGTLTDLFKGDSPVVLHNEQRILYEETDDLWYTRGFDGSGRTLYADGLKGYGAPTLAPDGKQIAFMRFGGPTGPVLTVFEVGKARGGG